MSTSEFASWVAYVRENGPLDMQRRYDEPAAMIAHTVAAANGSRAKVEDFLRYAPKSNLSDLDQSIAKILRAK